MTGQVAARVGAYSAVIKRSTDQSIPNNTATAISFDTTPIYDTGGFFSSGNPTRLTAPIPGVYLASISSMPWADSSTGIRQLLFKQNGTTYYGLNLLLGQNTGIGYFAAPGGVMTFKMAASDFIEVFVIHQAGTSLAMSGSNGVPQFALALVA